MKTANRGSNFRPKIETLFERLQAALADSGSANGQQCLNTPFDSACAFAGGRDLM